MLRFLIRRLLAILATLLMVTAALYAVLMLAPAEERAELYLPKGNSNNPGLRPEAMIERVIEEKGLNDPYPVQYVRWVAHLLRGDWGWSPSLRGDVLDALVARTPVTAELTLYSVILLVPLGIASGVISGHRQNRPFDHVFRILAFTATSVPPFILALVLLTIFYAGLRWFPPGRIGIAESQVVTSSAFISVTGLLTLDGLLNGRTDITINALRHLVLPAITLSLAHWATLGRVTRAAMIEELSKDYILAARGRGLPRQSVIWIHALRNVVVPALNSTALSAAALVTGVFVIEAVFGFPGVSELITKAMVFQTDTPIAMGFALYSVLVVSPLMLILDVLQGVVDPRIREEVGER